MYPQSVSALISKNVGNTLTNYKTWGGILYNVKDTAYGAKGDGVTNDSANINSALTVAIANNGRAYLPPGDYLITDTTILSKMMYLDGDGRLKFVTARGTSYLYAGQIKGAMTLYVPEMWATPNDALNQYLQYKLNLGFNVTISVADGTYTVNSGSFYAAENIAFGDLIDIIGNITSPANVTINLFNSAIGFYANNCRIGTINGFSIVGNGSKGGADPEINVSNIATWDATKIQQGIYAEINAAIKKVGKSIYIRNCYYGIQAASGATIYCEDGDSIDRSAVEASPTSVLTHNVLVRGCGDAGIFAYESGVIYCKGAVSCYNNDGNNVLGSGIIAEFDASIWADSAFCFGNFTAGFQARSNSSVKANTSGAWNNNKNGYFSAMNSQIEAITGDSYQNTNGYRADNSVIYALNSQANYNTQNGYYGEDGAYLYLEGAKGTNNTQYAALLNDTSSAFMDSYFNTNSVSNGSGVAYYAPRQMPAFTALPTASASYRGQMVYVQGGSSVADQLYVCLKSAAGTYSWKSIMTG